LLVGCLVRSDTMSRDRDSDLLTVVPVTLSHVKAPRPRVTKKERHDAEDSPRVKTMCLINNNIRINSNSNNSGLVYCCAGV